MERKTRIILKNHISCILLSRSESIGVLDIYAFIVKQVKHLVKAARSIGNLNSDNGSDRENIACLFEYASGFIRIVGNNSYNTEILCFCKGEGTHINVVFCKNCAMQFDASQAYCPQCGTRTEE